MNDLRRAVKRRTVEPVPAARRRLIVALMPGDVIGFREERRRRWYLAPIGKVYGQVVRWTVDAERSEARKGKR